MPIEDLRGERFKLMDILLMMDIPHLPHPMVSSKSANLRKCGDVGVPKKVRWRAS